MLGLESHQLHVQKKKLCVSSCGYGHAVMYVPRTVADRILRREWFDQSVISHRTSEDLGSVMELSLNVARFQSLNLFLEALPVWRGFAGFL